jgi:signal transduction histidine kinase
VRQAARAAAASSVGVAVELATERGGELGQAAVALTRRKPFWASARPAAVHRRHGVHGVDLGRSALRPDAVELAESRARIAAGAEERRRLEGELHDNRTEQASRSADGVTDQPGERRMDRHRGAGRPRE